MEHFKAYLTNQGSTKEEEIRRFSIDSDVVTNYVYLKERLQVVFPSLHGKRFTITWKGKYLKKKKKFLIIDRSFIYYTYLYLCSSLL